MYHGATYVDTLPIEVGILDRQLEFVILNCSDWPNVYVLLLIGDLYGGSHYSQLCSATMTPQGRAIQEPAMKFGNGKTLPYTPCKKGYIPFQMTTGKRLYACMYHNKARCKRLVVNSTIVLRKGEFDYNNFEIIRRGILDSGIDVVDDAKQSSISIKK